MKVFLDTNVLVSAVATRGLCADVLRVVLAEHQLCLSDTVLGELDEVLHHKLRVPAATLKDVLRFLKRHGTRVGKGATPTVQVRDAGDAVILAEAMAGEVDVFVTGDRDLLDIADRVALRIIAPRGFWEMLRSTP